MSNLAKLLVFACLVFTVCSVPILKDDMKIVEKNVKQAIAAHLLGDEQGLSKMEKLVDHETMPKETKAEKLVEDLAFEHEQLVEETTTAERLVDDEERKARMVDSEEINSEEEDEHMRETRMAESQEDNSEEEEEEEEHIRETRMAEEVRNVVERAVKEEQEIVKEQMKLAKEIVKKALKAERGIAEENVDDEEKSMKAEKIIAEKAMEAEQLIGKEVLKAESKIAKKAIEEEKEMSNKNNAEPLIGDEEEEEEKERRSAEESEEEEESKAAPLVGDEEEEEEKEKSKAAPLVDDREEERQEAKAEKLVQSEVVQEENPTMARIVSESAALATEEKAEPFIEAETKNPCETTNFKYYQPHPTEANKYYQCDPWGTFTQHTCKGDLIWDQWTLKCELEQNIRNLTTLIPEPIRRMSLFNCSVPEQSCQNGGKCLEKEGRFMCLCPTNFTGEVCEIGAAQLNMFSDIMNGNATLKDYANRLVKESGDLDLTYYQKYEKVLNKETYEKMMSYLRKYKDGLVRYDILISSLVEDVLVDVYPDAEFLRSFNVSSKNILTVVRLIPNLLSYAKYSSERYEEVFVQYQRVLDELFSYLNATCPNMTREAQVYTELTRLFLKEKDYEKIEKEHNEQMITDGTMKVYGRRFFHDELKTEKLVKETIKADFDLTLEKTYKLHRLLVTFDKAVAQEYKANPSFVHQPLIKSSLPGVSEVIALFDEIQTTNSQIWDSLVSYGFWYVTNLFDVPAPIADAMIVDA